jgi:predicted GNAT family acetyltransferase
MAAYLEEKFSLPQLHAELSHPHSEFYFAMQNNQVQGYLKLNVGDAQTELKNNHSIEIERIYVLKAFHGGGAGKELFAKALQIRPTCGWAFGKKILVPSTSIKKMDWWNLTNIFLSWEKMNKPTS